MNIGFIGLGIMGAPMAGHLLDAGHALYLHRVRDVSLWLVEKGGIACTSASDVVKAADIIITMLPDTGDVEAVMFGANGIADALTPGKLVIDMSSISPVATRDFAARIAKLDCGYVDAPVSGGEVGAKNASLTIMAGGSADDFARAQPLFTAMGKNITHIGPAGTGQTAKVANQIIVGLTLQAVSEALVLAERAGADPARVRTALMGGFAASRILEVHGERMVDKTFAPGFRIRLHRKDLRIAMDAAAALDVGLPSTAITLQMMNAAIANGDGELDHSALIRTVQALAGKNDSQADAVH